MTGATEATESPVFLLPQHRYRFLMPGKTPRSNSENRSISPTNFCGGPILFCGDT